MSDETSKPKGPPSHRPPGPPAGQPPRPTSTGPKTPAAPKPTFDNYVPDDATLTEKSSVTTWIAVIIIAGLMVAAFVHFRPILNGVPQTPETEVSEATTAKKKRGKRKKKRKKRPRRTAQSAAASNDSVDPNDFYDDEEFWDDEDLEVEDRFVLGDVFSQHDEVADAPVQKAEPEFIPPPEMWQPEGAYSPTSRWNAPGASKSDVVEISMSGSSGDGPLKPAQIRQVLSVNTLMPCYREVARRVPQMRGRVDLKVQIEPDGKPSRVTVTRSKLRSKQVEDCIVRKIRRLRFPKTDGRRTKFETHFDFD